MKRLFFLTAYFFAIHFLPLLAQKDPQYSQYIFNGMIINPAYAGSKEIVNINAFYRQQWMGLPGAPQTQTVSVDGSVNNKVNLGIYFLNDSWAFQRNTSLYGIYAYRIKINETSKIAFGLAAGISQLTLDGNKMNTQIPNDPLIPTIMEKKISPDINSGIYYNTERFFAGFSATNLLSDFTKGLAIKSQKNYFFSSGYLFDINTNIKFKPSILIKESFAKEPVNMDLNAFFLFKERIWLGLSFRGNMNLFQPISERTFLMPDAVAFILEYYVNDKFKIGYAYDISTTMLNKYGSHELSLGYYIFSKHDVPMLTPRLF